MATERMSRRAYARSRGVSEKAVRMAIGCGRIVPLADGRIDPEQADEDWLQWSRASLRASAPELEPVSSRVNGSGAGPAMPEEELDAFIQRVLGEALEEWEAERQSDVLARLEAVEAALKGLRHEMSMSSYTPGRVQRVVEQAAGDLTFKMGVVLHQVALAIAGRP